MRDSQPLAVMLIVGLLLALVWVFGVPIMVALEALPRTLIFIVGCGIVIWLQQVENCWPVALAALPWALSAILAHKYEGMWLGNEGGQHMLSFVLLVGGYAFEWWRRPSY